MNPRVVAPDSVLGSLPDQPGCYLMLDTNGKIIYIGATFNLKKRVTSYFQKDLPDSKTRRLVSKIKSVDYEIHKSMEAAFLHERASPLLIATFYKLGYNITQTLITEAH